MSNKMICPWCGSNMMYSVLGQNLTSSHFCDNVDCKGFQMVLPDNLWKDIFTWKQSQKDLEIAKKGLHRVITKTNSQVLRGYEYIATGITKAAKDTLKQIEHKENNNE